MLGISTYKPLLDEKKAKQYHSGAHNPVAPFMPHEVRKLYILNKKKNVG